MLRKDYLPFGKPNFSDEEIAAITHVMRSGWVGMGQETTTFEQELASYLNAPHVVTVNSCTSALFLALVALGIGPGNEVICPSLTWCATANVALQLGATPIFCDVDPATLCVNSELIQAKLTPRTKAVMLVHLGGLAVDVEKIRSVLPDNVAIVEDAAHALGAKFLNGQMVGSSGNLTCFSFYANKNLSTGEGGAIALFDEAMAGHLRSLRQNAMPVDAWKRFSHPRSLLYSQLTELGYKMNYTDLQACIGRVQLKRQPEFYSKRLAIAEYYYEHLQTCEPPLRFQDQITHPYHSRHLFVLQLGKMKLSRDDFLLALRARNIGASIHYSPLHRMPLYGVPQPTLPNTEAICERILTLPISASMNLDDAEYVVAQFKELLGEEY
ncbi:MAG: DegT/DnrJ/EryC1/StrS family aminotransferase [Anaerolineae bacterium]|nr:DegT/DnrJ/EryC1/StrS family aminotransferase [Anaerolineae bacterium]